MNNEDFGNRIKSFEDKSRYYLDRTQPIILRLDGSHFHTYVRSCEKPYDMKLITAMNETAKFLCEKIDGSRLAYVQSDEISILLFHPNDKANYWFDGNLQKIVSTAAGMCSAYFSHQSVNIFGEYHQATFDCRAFNVPKEDVNDVFVWRQTDAIRNSVQMLARSIYTHTECNNKNVIQLKDMCKAEGFVWEESPLFAQRGRCAVKSQVKRKTLIPKTNQEVEYLRNEWVMDNEIPLFSENKNYVNQHLISSVPVNLCEEVLFI